MKKFIVETYYTCTFKTVHTLDNLNDQELTNIDKRNDGEVEVIDVKLNNRKKQEKLLIRMTSQIQVKLKIMLLHQNFRKK